MKLSELIEVNHPSLRDLEIRWIAYDSRDVKPKSLFVATKGALRYIDSAIKNGAVCVVLEEDIPLSVPKIIVKNVRKELALLAQKFYNHPSKRLKVIGITGTFGKTTSTWLLKSIYETSGVQVGLIGTIRYEIGDKILSPIHTTPESLDIQAFFSELLQIGAKVVILEVSSHGIALSRVEGVDFDIAGFTVLDRDHLDFHGSLEEYKQTKIRLFSTLKPTALAVLNYDDPNFEEFKKATTTKIVTYGTKNCDVIGKIVSSTDNGIEITVHWNNKEGKIFSPLLGTHNLYNILLATTCALKDGIRFECIQEGIKKVTCVPGRFERIGRVVIDYAHTPGALRWALNSARKIARGRVICIFGCGGDRDKGKRPQMGKIASELADWVILTTDNPRSEDPQSIVQDIIKGISITNYEVILDRKEAIYKGIERSSPEDIVIVVGKGHEKYQLCGEIKIPWDEKKIIKEIMKELGVEGGENNDK
jgi:UDP-N-acetylmuramoyl-L-alanyl-D-glutamate--2,6-diaminopimelate ligase